MFLGSFQVSSQALKQDFLTSALVGCLGWMTVVLWRAGLCFVCRMFCSIPGFCTLDRCRWVGAPLVAQQVKNPSAMQETQFSSLGGKDPLEKQMATHSNPVKNPMDRGAWQVIVHGGHKESDMTEQPSKHWITHSPSSYAHQKCLLTLPHVLGKGQNHPSLRARTQDAFLSFFSYIFCPHHNQGRMIGQTCQEKA